MKLPASRGRWPPRSSARGFTRFEWIGTVLVVGVLATVLLHHLLRYQDLARTAVMEMTVANMRSGLRLRVAELMMANRNSEIAALVQENPIRWLDRPPPNYLGVLAQVDPERIPSDSWYFDANRHELVYLFPENNAGAASRGDFRHLHVHVNAVTAPQSDPNRTVAEGVALTTILEK